MTNAPGIFTLEDKNGNLIADVRGKKNAEDFAALPEKTILFDIMVATLNDIADNKGKFNEGLEEFLNHNNLRK